MDCWWGWGDGGSFRKKSLTEQKFNELVQKRRETPSQFRIENELLKKFNELILSTNRRIFLVIAPYHPSYFERYENLNEANDFLTKIDNISNVTVFNLSSFISVDSLFWDTTHLNYEGAKIFSAKLKNLLKQKPIGNEESFEKR